MKRFEQKLVVTILLLMCVLQSSAQVSLGANRTRTRYYHSSRAEVLPKGEWYAMNYDDSSWGKYTNEISFPEYEAFWVRQKFVITDDPSKHAFILKYAHDNEAKIYLNGKLIHDCGYTCYKYRDLIISSSDLIQGTNIIAAYVNDSDGGEQYICLDFYADDDASIVKDEFVGGYVDLGLSSKTLWADINIGAETETEPGGYYAWAETTTKATYSQSNYKYATGIEKEGLWDENLLVKYCTKDAVKTLSSDDNVASMQWGAEWSIPTPAQFQELIDECSWIKEGNGYRVTGRNGKSIYLPFAGYRYDGESVNETLDFSAKGYYMTNTVGESSYGQGKYVDLSSTGMTVSTMNRYYGLSVRPVTYSVFATDISISGKKYIGQNETITMATSSLPLNTTFNEVKWTSSDNSIATVNDKGVVTGVSEGEACITAILEGASADGSDITSQFIVTVKGGLLRSGDCGSSADYTLYEDGLLYIYGRGAIKDDMFKEQSDIVNVVIEEGITSIGFMAFGDCENLTSISIPRTMSKVDYSFDGCKNLSQIFIEDIITWCNIQDLYKLEGAIEKTLFVKGEKIKTICFPEGITSIPDYVFRTFTNIEDVIIPNSVKSIGGHSFADCKGLTNVYLGKNVKKIGGYAFYGCNISAIYIEDISAWCKIEGLGNLQGDNQQFYSNRTLYVNGKAYNNLVIPEDITEIPNNAFRGFKNIENVYIPDGVKSIGDFAFTQCSGITSITIGKSVANIGFDAFANNNISTIYIKDVSAWCNIKELHQLTYYGTENKTLYIDDEECKELIIPTNVTVIPASAFREFKNIEKVKISEGVTSIEPYAFYGCSNVKSVSFSNSIATIGNGCFKNCKSITEISIPDNVISIGDNAFSDCSNIVCATLGNGLKIMGEKAFSGCSNLVNVKIGGGSIGHSAFFGCMNLTDIVLGNNVTEIGGSAFWYCISLKNITIGKGLKRIGEYAFSDCKITNIWIDDISAWCKIGGLGHLMSFSYYKTLYINGEVCKDLIIPEGVTEIPEYAFRVAEHIKTVSIPSSVVSIGDNAFLGCGIDTVKISSLSAWCNIDGVGNLTTAGKEKKCLLLNGVELNEVTLPEDISSIKPNTFKTFNHILYIYINSDTFVDIEDVSAGPEHVMWVVPQTLYQDYTSAENWNTLYRNKQLIAKSLYNNYTANVTADTNLSAIHLNVGDNNLPNILELKVIGTINSYDLAIMKSKMSSLRKLDLSEASVVSCIYEYEKGYKSVNDELSRYCMNTNLIELTLPNTLKKINDYAFSDLVYMQDVKCGSKVLTSIGNYAFENTSALENVEIPTSVQTVGSYLFKQSGIEYVDMSRTSIVSFPENVFAYAKSMKTISLPSELQSIPYHAFLCCESLDSICIPHNVTSISEEAFGTHYGLDSRIWVNGEYIQFSPTKNLKHITFEENSNLENIGAYAFAYNISLQNFILPSSVNTIGEGAFKDCTSLTDVVFSPGITEIGNNVFQNCIALKNVSMPSTVTRIGEYAFQNCEEMEVFKVPSSAEYIGNYAFDGCNKLMDVYSYTIKPTPIEYNTFSTWNLATLHVPAQGYYYYYYDVNWKYFFTLSTFLEPYDYFYAKEDITIQASTGAIEGNPEATIYDEGGIIVKDDVEQTFGDIHIKCDANNFGSLIGGLQTKMKQDCKLYIDITVLANKWYYFCFPYDIQLKDIQKSGNYVFRTYDTALRAQGQSGWVNLEPSETKLIAGKGYIFQTNKSGQLCLPVSAPDFTTMDVHQSLVEFAKSGEGKDTDESWNFVGNPYTSYLGINGVKYDYPITYWDVESQTYVSVRQGDDDYVFHPFMAFFVQKPVGVLELVCEAVDRMTKTQAQEYVLQSSNAKAMGGMSSSTANQRRLINLELTNGVTRDKTRVVYNNEKSLTYEKDCDAAKFISAATSQIYTLDGKQTQYSINERPSGNVPVGLQIVKDGTYTISATRMDADVRLKDNLTGALYNLAQDDYTFEAKAGTLNNRFEIVFVDDNVTGLKGIDQIEKTVSNASFYNLGGARTSRDAHGMKIMKQGKNTRTVITK